MTNKGRLDSLVCGRRGSFRNLFILYIYYLYADTNTVNCCITMIIIIYLHNIEHRKCKKNSKWRKENVKLCNGRPFGLLYGARKCSMDSFFRETFSIRNMLFLDSSLSATTFFIIHHMGCNNNDIIVVYRLYKYKQSDNIFHSSYRTERTKCSSNRNQCIRLNIAMLSIAEARNWRMSFRKIVFSFFCSNEWWILPLDCDTPAWDAIRVLIARLYC